MDKHLKNRVSLFKPSHFLAFGFGSGLSPIMPGTFGSLAAIPLIYFLSFLPIELYIFVCILSFVIGIKICSIATQDLGVHDHGAIVWDEIAGMMIVFVAVPIGIWTIVIGFLLFRLFDIVKPWPISVLDKKLDGGFGIMIDDVLAGLFALVILHLMLVFLPANFIL